MFSDIACHSEGNEKPAYLRGYGRYIFPYIEILATSGLGEIRERLMRHAQGRVVEIGAGAGQNLVYLPNGVHSYIATDPSPVMVAKAKQKVIRRRHRFPGAQVAEAAAETMPIRTETADTVVSFLVLCSVRDPQAALSEIHRVLKPRGRFLFFEHVLAGKDSTARWQHRMNPLWKRVFCGCNLNRTTAENIQKSGFRFTQLDRYRSSKMGPPITSNVIEGVAEKL